MMRVLAVRLVVLSNVLVAFLRLLDEASEAIEATVELFEGWAEGETDCGEKEKEKEEFGERSAACWLSSWSTRGAH